MSEKNHVAPKLKRTMTAGQMEMISLGGAIGVGLFMGSKSTIKWTGPSVLLAYAFVGLILYIVMRALGEISSSIPAPKSRSPTSQNSLTVVSPNRYCTATPEVPQKEAPVTASRMPFVLLFKIFPPCRMHTE